MSEEYRGSLYGLDHPTWTKPNCFYHRTIEEAQAAILRTYGAGTEHVVVQHVVTMDGATARRTVEQVDIPRAADLPDGTVVADGDKVWIKNHPYPDYPWKTTSGSYEHNVLVDEVLAAGARVLRSGYDGSNDD